MKTSKDYMEDFKDKKVLFCFLDEAGNFDFSLSGSPCYLYTALVTNNPFPLDNDILRAKYRLILNNLPFSKSHQSNDYFHATEDALHTRLLAFETIATHTEEFRVYSVVIQKDEVAPEQQEQRSFFAGVFGELLKNVIAGELANGDFDHLCIMLDRIPVHKKQGAILSSIKRTLKGILGGRAYSLSQMDSKCEHCLQAADYCSWALYRYHANGETAPRTYIEQSIVDENVVFKARNKETQ